MTMTKRKNICRWCGKSSGKIKFYIIADDMENPKPYHSACMAILHIEALKKFYLSSDKHHNKKKKVKPKSSR